MSLIYNNFMSISLLLALHYVRKCNDDIFFLFTTFIGIYVFFIGTERPYRKQEKELNTQF